MPEGFFLTSEWAERIKKMWLWQRNLRASGNGLTFKNSDTSPTITLTPPSRLPDTPASGLPSGGLKNEVLTKYSDGGPAVWGEARML